MSQFGAESGISKESSAVSSAAQRPVVPPAPQEAYVDQKRDVPVPDSNPLPGAANPEPMDPEIAAALGKLANAASQVKVAAQVVDAGLRTETSTQQKEPDTFSGMGQGAFAVLRTSPIFGVAGAVGIAPTRSPLSYSSHSATGITSEPDQGQNLMPGATPVAIGTGPRPASPPSDQSMNVSSASPGDSKVTNPVVVKRKTFGCC